MESYIKFYAQVHQASAIHFQKLVEHQMMQGMKTLHLLLSTPGGSVHDGISLHNFLKGLPIEVNTYNFGSVDSIGVVIFCAGGNRFSVPHARFLLHPVAMQVMANQTFDEPLLEEKLKLLRADQRNIANVVASTINKPVDEVLKLIHNRTTFDPEQARESGLVTQIKQVLVPQGALIQSVYDSQQQPQQFILPAGQQMPTLRGITLPSNSFTAITDTFTSLV